MLENVRLTPGAGIDPGHRHAVEDLAPPSRVARRGGTEPGDEGQRGTAADEQPAATLRVAAAVSDVLFWPPVARMLSCWNVFPGTPGAALPPGATTV